MERDWRKDLEKFETFLGEIEIEKYAHLRGIKTVERDLPKALLPLEIYYRYYWETTDFKDYDEIFEIYWSEKLSPHIYNFIKKYFYGCSLKFVEEGFRARLYRIWMFILTQFHFQYLWNSMFAEKLASDPDIDSTGIDAVVNINNVKVGIQVKKVSYRPEASDRRFTRRQQKLVDIIVEVPYLVIDVEELKRKLSNPRVRESTKTKIKSALRIFNKYFIKLSNGFVILKKDYLRHVHSVILKNLEVVERGKKITYDEILIW